MGLVLIGTVNADLVADISMNTTGDVTTETYLSTDGGDINYDLDNYAGGNSYFNLYGLDGNPNLDITNRYDEKNTYRSGVTLKFLANRFSDAADILIYGETRYGSDYIKPEMMSIVNALSKMFVTRPEYDRLKAENQMLHYRLEAVEQTLDQIAPEQYCDKKIEVAYKYDMNGVDCGETEYKISRGYNDQDWAIGVTNKK